MNILFAASEAYPLIKTGGLADVAASLPRTLIKQGHSVRLVLPAYGKIMAQFREMSSASSRTGSQPGLKPLPSLRLEDAALGSREVKLWQTRLPGTRVIVWLVDTPALSGRQGNPYGDSTGQDWPDNHRRFYDFCAAAVELAQGRAGVNWQPDLVHCNDWQTGMICPLLNQESRRPATVFTIHNLAYQGLFPRAAFEELGLPWSFWRHDRLEFYDQLSFMKAGLVYADRITTVSPTYATEIQTQAFGCGLEGLLQERNKHLLGILNGIDTREWNPGSDPHLSQTYHSRSLGKKAFNKAALQVRQKLRKSDELPLLGFVGRLVDQKGIGLLLPVLRQALARKDCQVVILGSGDGRYERALTELATAHPRLLSVTLSYDEALAHQIEAGADMFLMPSLYEPCGLNQMYSLRYGTPPIVHAVGGLKDTIIDTAQNPETANGFAFYHPTPEALWACIQRALSAYGDKTYWRQLQRNGMRGDFTWDRSAAEYGMIYEELLMVAGRAGSTGRKSINT